MTKLQRLYTPEPWYVLGDYIRTEDKGIATTITGDQEGLSNAKRITHCVNACATIADVAVIPELVKCLQSIVTHNEALIEGHKISKALMSHVKLILSKAGGFTT